MAFLILGVRPDGSSAFCLSRPAFDRAVLRRVACYSILVSSCRRSEANMHALDLEPDALHAALPAPPFTGIIAAPEEGDR
jgi:hypothetical protein